MVADRRKVLRFVACGGLISIAGCSLRGPTPTLSVPGVELRDEPVTIEVTGLEANEPVTLRSRTRDRTGEQWTASATYEAGSSGAISVREQRPVESRYYEGTAPMGLFWAMRPAGSNPDSPLRPGIRFVPPRGAYEVRLEAEIDGRVVAETATTRRLFHPEITQQQIDRDGLVGHLFLPPGDDTVPGVIHLHGAGGRPFRGVGRLLASRGFAALTLKYFGTPDPLPASLREVPIEYVERAVDWVRNLRRVDSRGIGLFGFSRGGPLALLAATRTDDIGGVVGWVPSSIVYEGLDPSRTPAGTSAWSIDGDPVPYLELAEPDVGPPPTPALPYFEPPLETATPEQLESATVPVEDIGAPIHLISVTDDRRWPSPRLSRRAISRLEEHDYPYAYGHDRHEGAGHFIYPPYLPTAGTMRTERNVYGGTPAANARANAEAWKRTLSFLRTSLDSQ